MLRFTTYKTCKVLCFKILLTLTIIHTVIDRQKIAVTTHASAFTLIVLLNIEKKKILVSYTKKKFWAQSIKNLLLETSSIKKRKRKKKKKKAIKKKAKVLANLEKISTNTSSILGCLASNFKKIPKALLKTVQ